MLECCFVENSKLLAYNSRETHWQFIKDDLLSPDNTSRKHVRKGLIG